MQRAAFTLLSSCLVLGVAGCRASAKASANVNTGREAEDVGGEAPPSEPAPPGDPESELDPDSEMALIGARHDLRLAPSATTPACSCLAVAVGGADNPSLSWIGPKPIIDANRQLVIALGSEGIACPSAPEGSLGASYWGYRNEGDDVIVVVETAKPGRPVTNGAVIPKPAGSGQVYVRPLTKDVPYGRPLDTTQKDCRIGNPG